MNVLLDLLLITPSGAWYLKGTGYDWQSSQGAFQPVKKL